MVPPTSTDSVATEADKHYARNGGSADSSHRHSIPADPDSSERRKHLLLGSNVGQGDSSPGRLRHWETPPGTTRRLVDTDVVQNRKEPEPRSRALQR